MSQWENFYEFKSKTFFSSESADVRSRCEESKNVMSDWLEHSDDLESIRPRDVLQRWKSAAGGGFIPVDGGGAILKKPKPNARKDKKK